MRPITATTIADAGAAISHQPRDTSVRASLTISPSDGSGGCVPRPRKLSADSVRIAHDRARATCTTIGAVTLGSTWRTQQAAAPEAEHAAGLDEVELADAQHRTAGDADEDRRVHDGDGDDGVDPAGPEGGDDGEGEEDRREGEHDVGDHADGAVGPATEEAGGDPGGRPDRRRDGDGDDGDAQRGEDPFHHPRDDVAAELVGAHPVRGRRRGEAVGRVLLQRRIRRQAEGGEDRDDHQHDDDDEADDAGGRRPQPAQPAAAGRRPAPPRRPATVTAALTHVSFTRGSMRA